MCFLVSSMFCIILYHKCLEVGFLVGGKGLTRPLWVVQTLHFPGKGLFQDWPVLAPENWAPGIFWPIRVCCMPGAGSHAVSFCRWFILTVVFVEHLLSCCGLGASITEVSHIGTIYVYTSDPIKTVDSLPQVSFLCWQDFARGVSQHCWRAPAHAVWLHPEGTPGSWCLVSPQTLTHAPFPVAILLDPFAVINCTCEYHFYALCPFREPASLRVVLETLTHWPAWHSAADKENDSS